MGFPPKPPLSPQTPAPSPPSPPSPPGQGWEPNTPPNPSDPFYLPPGTTDAPSAPRALRGPAPGEPTPAPRHPPCSSPPSCPGPGCPRPRGEAGSCRREGPHLNLVPLLGCGGPPKSSGERSEAPREGSRRGARPEAARPRRPPPAASRRPHSGAGAGPGGRPHLPAAGEAGPRRRAATAPAQPGGAAHLPLAGMRTEGGGCGGAHLRRSSAGFQDGGRRPAEGGERVGRDREALEGFLRKKTQGAGVGCALVTFGLEELGVVCKYGAVAAGEQRFAPLPPPPSPQPPCLASGCGAPSGAGAAPAPAGVLIIN